MTARWFDQDEALLEELAAARAEEAPPADQADLIMAGYDIVMADTPEAVLAHDSLVHEELAVRSTELASRMLSFTHDDGEIDVEIEDGRVTGHVDPARELTVTLEQPMAPEAPTVSSRTDALGSFSFDLRSPATFRLRFSLGDGRDIATPWIDGPHQTRP